MPCTFFSPGCSLSKTVDTWVVVVGLLLQHLYMVKWNAFSFSASVKKLCFVDVLLNARSMSLVSNLFKLW